MKVKIVFLGIWILALLVSLFSIIKGPYFFGFKSPSSILNFIQRFTALTVFQLLAFQIVLNRWLPKSIHAFQGGVIMFLIMLHPVSFLIIKYLTRRVLDPFYIFTDFCLLCPVKTELFYTFGRVGFWLILVAVAVAVLRGMTELKNNWRYFYFLVYPMFVLISLHSWFIGTDIHSSFFAPIFWGGISLVFISFVRVLLINASKR